jgi:hypothetical protein
MAGTSAGVTSAVIFGGFLCIGLFLLAIATAIILSLIPIYTSNHSQQGYGSEYTFDSLMLKLSYTNNSDTYNGTTIGNSSALSSACTTYFETLGYSNFAGCVVYNGQAWAPYNNSKTSRRRRRAPTTVGMYAIFTVRIFRTVACPSESDGNKTESSSSISACNLQGIKQCNKLVNDLLTTFAPWASTNAVILEVLNTEDSYDAISALPIYGVPRQIAAAVASDLSGVSGAVIGNLQRGCRYVGQRSIAYIDSVISSQTSSNTTTDVTTESTG